MLAEPIDKLKLQETLFDGDLSDSSSDSSLQPPATVISHVSSSKKANRSVTATTPRPSRNRKPRLSYAESDSEEDETFTRSAIPSMVARGKRRRESSGAEGPSKRPRIGSAEPLRKRAYSTSHGTSSQHFHPFPSASQPLPSAPTSPRKLQLSVGSTAVIKLNPSGDPELNLGKGYWWPGKVITLESMEKAVFQLYGDDGHGPSRQVLVNALSSDIIRSVFLGNGSRRYSDDEFQDGDFVEKAKYRQAIMEVLRDDKKEDDDTLQAPDETRSSSEDPLDFFGSTKAAETKEEWRAPSPSDYIAEQGYIDQNVLCKANPASSIYWPAKIKELVFPTKPSEKLRYKILFFDWKTKNLPKDCFYSHLDDDVDGFASCEIDRVKIDEWRAKNSSTTQSGEDELIDIDISTLPKASNKLPKPEDFIERLGIDEQFPYIIPFLEKVLKEGYPPSQERIDAWMKGGSSRQALTNNPIGGGHLAEVEYVIFQKLVKAWAMPSHDSELSPQSNIRPRGSERYEALSLKDKGLFAFDILVGEGVIQLLLLRHGVRKSTAIGDDEEEERLHRTGWELSEEDSTSNLVTAVLEYRKVLRAKKGLPQEAAIEEKKGGEKRRARASIKGGR